MNKEKSIKIAFIYGSYAKGQETASSDVDLMIVADDKTHSFMGKITELEKKLEREINYTLYSSNEFKEKRKER